MLSPGQVRIALLQMYHATVPMYNMSFDMLIRGVIDIDLLTRGLNYLLLRHPVLRTNVFLEGDRLLAGQTTKSITVDRDQDEYTFANTPFDLARDCLIRVLYLPASSRLVFLFSDLIIDGHTVLHFFNDLSTIYTALASNRVPLFKYIPAPAVESTGGEKAVDFWRIMALPKDLTLHGFGLPGTGFEEKRIPFVLTGAEFARVKAETHRLSVTLFDFLVAKFQLLLARQTGRRRITLDTLFTDHEEKRIGLYNNVVLLPVDLNLYLLNDMDGFVQQAAGILHQIKSHIAPLETLANALGLTALPNVRIHFEYANKNTARAFSLGPASLSSNLYENSSNTIRQLLVLNVCEGIDQVDFYFSYRKACFTDDMIAGFIEEFKQLVLPPPPGMTIGDFIGAERAEGADGADGLERPVKDKRLIAYTYAGKYPNISYSAFKAELDSIA